MGKLIAMLLKNTRTNMSVKLSWSSQLEIAVGSFMGLVDRARAPREKSKRLKSFNFRPILT